jgi:hypothetical protein
MRWVMCLLCLMLATPIGAEVINLQISAAERAVVEREIQERGIDRTVLQVLQSQIDEYLNRTAREQDRRSENTLIDKFRKAPKQKRDAARNALR